MEESLLLLLSPIFILESAIHCICPLCKSQMDQWPIGTSINGMPHWHSSGFSAAAQHAGPQAAWALRSLLDACQPRTFIKRLSFSLQLPRRHPAKGGFAHINNSFSDRNAGRRSAKHGDKASFLACKTHFISFLWALYFSHYLIIKGITQ